MKIGKAIMLTGAVMFGLGLVLFYSIEIGQTDPNLRFIKNMGTFTGLSGMGVAMAGVLFHLITRNEIPVEEKFDV